jgi:hypothetical protein
VHTIFVEPSPTLFRPSNCASHFLKLSITSSSLLKLSPHLTSTKEGQERCAVVIATQSSPCFSLRSIL